MPIISIHSCYYEPSMHVCLLKSWFWHRSTFAYFEEFSSHILTWLPICSWSLPLSRHRSLAWHLGGGFYNTIHDLICCIICCIRWIVVASIPWTNTAWKNPANELKEKKTESLLCHFGFVMRFFGELQQAAQSLLIQVGQRWRLGLMENISK